MKGLAKMATTLEEDICTHEKAEYETIQQQYDRPDQQDLVWEEEILVCPDCKAWYDDVMEWWEV